MGKKHPSASVSTFALDQEPVYVGCVVKFIAIAADQPKAEAGDYDPFGVKGRDAERGRQRGLGVGAPLELGKQTEFDGGE